MEHHSSHDVEQNVEASSSDAMKPSNGPSDIMEGPAAQDCHHESLPMQCHKAQLEDIHSETTSSDAELPCLDGLLPIKRGSKRSTKDRRKLRVVSAFVIVGILGSIAALTAYLMSTTTTTSNDRIVPSTPSPTVEQPSPAPQTPTILEQMGDRTCEDEIPHPPLPGKKGAAFTLRDIGQAGSWVENLPKVIRLNPYWNYSWSPQRIPQQPYHIEFIPMLWGGNNAERMESFIENDIIPQIERGQAKRLLGFNEPDHPKQSNMAVETALNEWPKLEKIGIPLVSPSTAHPDREWMQQFAARAKKDCLRMEWVGVHWYGGASFQQFRRYMQNLHDMYGRPLLITEFAPADWKAETAEDNKWSEEMVLEFMKEALPWLEATPWIAGYAWFSFKQSWGVGSTSALYDAQGDLTMCGRFYASVTTDSPRGDRRIGTDEDPVFVARPRGQAQLDCGSVVSDPPPLPGKKGAAMVLSSTNLKNLNRLSKLRASWNHNWGPHRVDRQPDDTEFLPTLWGGRSLDAARSRLLKQVAPHVASGSVRRLLGFHEPDNPNQSNIPVSRALEVWPALESLGIPLVSPSCSNPFGEWLEEFMSNADLQCLRVDWVGIRWSGPASFSKLQADLGSLYAKFNRPLLLTSLAPNSDNPGDMLRFMKKALPWLESTDYIQGYAWAPSDEDSTAALFHRDGTLTVCGKYFASVTPLLPSGDQSIYHKAAR